MLKQENVCYFLPFNLNLFNTLVCMTPITMIWKRKKKEKEQKEEGK